MEGALAVELDRPCAVTSWLCDFFVSVFSVVNRELLALPCRAVVKIMWVAKRLVLCLALTKDYFLPSFHPSVRGCRRAALGHAGRGPASLARESVSTMVGFWGGCWMGQAVHPPDDGVEWGTLTGERSPCAGRRQI